MATLSQWLAGARPATLPAALAPVIAGTGAAAELGSAQWGRAALALAVAVSLQIAVNYANDYSDGVRGTDDDRVGPLRLIGARLASPAAVKRAAVLAFTAAALAGLVLVAVSGYWWLLLVGAATFPAAWFYTGGHRPYGYSGLGEVFVFIFFGLVAVLGTTYTQAGRLSGPALAAAVGVGCLACAILVTNNLRDIPTDQVSGKRTLAVRLGDRVTRQVYLVLIAVPFGLVVGLAVARPPVGLALLAAALAWPAVRLVADGASGLALIPALKATGRTGLAYAVLLAVTLAWS